MSFHPTRKTAAKGCRPSTIKDWKCGPRIAVSLSEDDMAVLCWWAAKKGIPAASIMRDAVFAYLQCVRADFQREQAASVAARPAVPVGPSAGRGGEINQEDSSLRFAEDHGCKTRHGSAT